MTEPEFPGPTVCDKCGRGLELNTVGARACCPADGKYGKYLWRYRDTPVTERVREDLADLAQKAAQQILDDNAEREREQIAAESRYQYDTRETYYCLVHQRIDLALGRTWFEAETIGELPYGLRPLRTIGPSAELAVRRMHWVYAMQLVGISVCNEHEAKWRAARARFVQAEVVKP